MLLPWDILVVPGDSGTLEALQGLLLLMLIPGDPTRSLLPDGTMW